MTDSYHKSPGVSHHRLMDFVSNYPLYYYKRHITHELPDQPQSKAQLVGELAHCLTYEADKFAERYAVAGDFDKRTKAGKADWEAFRADNAGKTIVEEWQALIANRIASGIENVPAIGGLFKNGEAEKVFRAQVGGLELRCRCDWYSDVRDDWGRPLIVDLKTIESLQEFDRQFFNFNYYRQAAFYQTTVRAALGLDFYPRFLFVVAEKDEPFQCVIREPGEASLDIGRQENARDLKRLGECYAKNEWPGAPTVPVPVELPDWKIAKNVEAVA